MNKDRAIQILMAHACCSFTTEENKLCVKCPWNETKDCEETVINEAVIIETMSVLRGE